MTDVTADFAQPERPAASFRALRDWTILMVGVGSLAFAILASTTGLVTAHADHSSAAEAKPPVVAGH